MSVLTGLLVSSDSWSDFLNIRCDITLSYAVRYLFRELCQRRHSVHHSLPPVPKCSNVTDPYELPDFWLPNSPDQNIFHYKIWDSESTSKSTGPGASDSALCWQCAPYKCLLYYYYYYYYYYVNDLRQHLIDVWVRVEQSVIDDGIDQWRRRLHACIRARRGHLEYSTWHS